MEQAYNNYSESKLQSVSITFICKMQRKPASYVQFQTPILRPILLILMMSTDQPTSQATL